jgi:integrase
MKEAKIIGARFHDLRATAITTWLLRGLPMPFAMARSGHADPRTFMRYVRMVEEIREKQRGQLREWELAASLTELAANGAGISSDDIQVERLEFVN